MKRIVWIFIVLCSLVGCTRSEIQGEGDSYVTLSAVADPSLNMKSAKASGYTIPVPDDYSYTVRHAGDKSVVAQGASTAGLGTLALMAGNYLFEVASVGEASADAPSYAGSATFSVKKGATTKVEVSAKLASSVVEVRFSEAVKSGFSSYKATISAQGVTQTAVFDASTPEGKLLYLPAPATKVTCTIEVTTRQGLPFSTTQTVESLAAADLLSWTVDIPVYEEKPTDPLVLELVLDRTLNEEQKNFTLSLNPTAMGAPVVAGRLFDLSLPVGVKYQTGTEVKIDLATKGGLAKVLLMFPVGQEPLVDCAPQVLVDLLAATPEELTAMGIQFTEGGTVGATASLLDLSAMTKKMPGFAESVRNYYATIGLLDQSGQYVAREVVFNVYGVSITTLDYAYDVNQGIDWFGSKGLVNGTYATIKGRYNVDEEPEGLVFQYRVQGQTAWQVVTPTVNRTTKEVTAQIGVVPNAQVVEYALASSEETARVATFIAAKGPQYTNMSFDVWPDGEQVNAVNWGSPNFAGMTPPLNLGKITTTTRQTGRNGSGYSARIASSEAFSIFASGGLFSGTMDNPDTGKPYKSAQVGKPFTGRPKKMVGYFKYKGNPIKTDGEYAGFPGNEAQGGQTDMCEIAIKLENWGDGDYKVRWCDGFFGNPGSAYVDQAGVACDGRKAKVVDYDGNGGTFDADIRQKLSVGYGRITSRGAADWTRFEIDITYFQNIQPTHIILTAVSSAYGGYMSGGVGSELWVDDLELIY